RRPRRPRDRSGDRRRGPRPPGRRDADPDGSPPLEVELIVRPREAPRSVTVLVAPRGLRNAPAPMSAGDASSEADGAAGPAISHSRPDRPLELRASGRVPRPRALTRAADPTLLHLGIPALLLVAEIALLQLR